MSPQGRDQTGQSPARPALRERRLSRVHFEGDRAEEVNANVGEHQQQQQQAPRAGQTRPVARFAAEEDEQSYFDSKGGYASSSGEESRGRAVHPGENQDDERDQAKEEEEHTQRPYIWTPFPGPRVEDDLSPRSTTFTPGPQPHSEEHVSPVQAKRPLQPAMDAQVWQANANSPHAIRPSVPQPAYNPSAPRQSILSRQLADYVPAGGERRASAPVAGMGMRPYQQAQQQGFAGPGFYPMAADPYTAFPARMMPLSHGNSHVPFAGSPEVRRDSLPEYSSYAPPNAQVGPPYQSRPSQPLKPALRRSQTEEEVRKTTRDAVDIVHHHTQGLRRRNVPGGPTLESMPRNAGVLSNLLQLYGNTSSLQRGDSYVSKAGNDPEMSRSTSLNSYCPPRNGLGRTESAASFATTLCDDDLDPDDPRARGSLGDKEQQRPNLTGSRNMRYSYNGAADDATSVKSGKSLKAFLRRTKSFIVDEDAVYSDLTGKRPKVMPGSKEKSRRLSITKHVADILQRHNFMLKLAKALMTFGSPSHRLESQLNATAQVLQVDAQFIHLPTVVIASFGDTDTHTSETHFVKAGGGLDLGKLHHVHRIYRQVIHDEAGVQEGSAALSRLLKAPPIYKIWQRMIFAAICAGTIAPIGFGGSFVDAWVAGAFGAFLSFLQNYAVRKSAGYSNIFEISVATMTSFIARGLSTTNYFCYPALASSGVVLILPGYAILCGSLELASKNIVTGSVRMVYAIIYSLFLGFGIAVGSDLYILLDPRSRAPMQAAAAAAMNTYTLQGFFNATNGTTPFMLDGSWTFSNATDPSSGYNDALFEGNIACMRDPSWEWWRQGVSPYALIVLVPIFTLFLCLNNLQPIYSRQLPVMIVIACIGFVTNTIANKYIFNHSDVVSFIGAFVIGILGNLYSRIFRGTGFVVMVPGVLFLVPSGIAAAGGLAMTDVKGHGDSYSNGLMIGFRMVQVAIGITVGLFFSSFIVYSFGRRKQAALFAF